MNLEIVKYVVGVVAVITLIGFLVAGMPGPKTSPSPSATEPTKFEKMTGRPDPGARPDQAQQYMDKLARDSGGDWNKLSPEDQRYVNGFTSGHGMNFIRDRGRLLIEQEKATHIPPKHK